MQDKSAGQDSASATGSAGPDELAVQFSRLARGLRSPSAACPSNRRLLSPELRMNAPVVTRRGGWLSRTAASP